MNQYRARKGGVIAWRQSSDATTPPAETQTILRPHFKIVARGHALVARSYGTTATIPAGQTIRRPIFSILAKGRAIVWRSYGTTEELPPTPTPTPFYSVSGGYLRAPTKKPVEDKPSARVKLSVSPASSFVPYSKMGVPKAISKALGEVFNGPLTAKPLPPLPPEYLDDDIPDEVIMLALQ